MSILLHPFFWLAHALTVALLTGVGLLIAYLVVPKPPTYHRTTYFEFGLPSRWICQREGTETVCRPGMSPPYDAVIIFTAKFRNDDDSLEGYRRHVAKPTKRTGDDGREFESKVIHVGERKIGEYRWIDALHFESEIRGYYTRYLATTTAQIGVLITFSTHASKLAEHTRDFDASVESLRIHQSPSRYN